MRSEILRYCPADYAIMQKGGGLRAVNHGEIEIAADNRELLGLKLVKH